MRTIAFEKYEGLGNDFVIVEADASALARDEVVRLCDRHRGIGADGVLFVGPPGAAPSMVVVNADGSDAEMCGNGLRCVARFLVASGRVTGPAFEVATGAGPHAVRVLDDGRVEVSMRAPSLAPRDVPLASDAPWIDAPIEVGGVPLRLTVVSMGNPHAISFDPLDAATRARLGPLLEAHPRFPARVNAGFAAQHDATTLRLDVYERGVGWTEACGTGACAAAVAAVETGRAARGVPLTVHLPGGALEIVVGPEGARVSMTGPARPVFRGEVTLD